MAHITAEVTIDERRSTRCSTWLPTSETSRGTTGLVGPMRMLSPVLAIGPTWERRNWVGLNEYAESGRR
jgi:hypothetical protein